MGIDDFHSSQNSISQLAKNYAMVATFKTQKKYIQNFSGNLIEKGTL